MEKTYCYFGDRGSNAMVFRSASGYHVWIATIEYEGDEKIKNMPRPRAADFTRLEDFKKAMEEYYEKRATLHAKPFEHRRRGMVYNFGSARLLHGFLEGLVREGIRIPDDCMKEVWREAVKEERDAALSHWGDVA